MDQDDKTIMMIVQGVWTKHNGRILKHQIIEAAGKIDCSPMHTILMIESLKDDGRISEPLIGVYKILKSTVQQTFD